MRTICALMTAVMGAGCGESTPESTGPSWESTAAEGTDGCQAAGVARTQITVTLTVAGLERRFRISAPAAADGVALPLMYAFQGGDAEGPFEQQARFDALTQSESMIMVYVDGLVVGNNEGAWQLNTTDTSTHDIELLDAILAEVSTQYCVDRTRVYATGYSLGSMFTYEVACQMNDRVAAIASVAGTMPVSPGACTRSAPIAIMHVHGDADATIPYASEWDWKAWDSVGTMKDVPSLVGFWRDWNDCENTANATTDDGQHTIHNQCAGGVRVEHHRLAGRDHWWPTNVGGKSTHRVVWDFVRQFRRE